MPTLFYLWLPTQGSNLKPPDPESGALPVELVGIKPLVLYFNPHGLEARGQALEHPFLAQQFHHQ
jgi:hypothetical protein